MKCSLKNTSGFLRGLGVTSPAVVIDKDRVQRNIRTMAAKAAAGGVKFRPHFKTHQSGAMGAWFHEEGVDAITVSSLPMAEYFAEFGWTDITLAFLLNPLELPRMGELARYLAGRGGKLGLTVDSPAAARALAAAELPVEAWLKIDTGYGRTGLAWDSPTDLVGVCEALGPGVPLAGLLTHSGHSYQARTRENLQTIWDTTVERMRQVRKTLGRGEDLALSLGDTPCCNSVNSLAGVDEVRPGNFVFSDLMQLEIGSCGPEMLAAAVACPVVGIYPQRGCLVVHGGAVQLSKEYLTGADGQAIYGLLGALNLDGENGPGLGAIIEEAPVVTLTQEHGTIAMDPQRFQVLLGDLEIGDLVLIWPVHSCLTCDLHRQYLTLNGEVLPRR